MLVTCTYWVMLWPCNCLCVSLSVCHKPVF